MDSRIAKHRDSEYVVAESQASIDAYRRTLDFYVATASPEAAAEAQGTFDLDRRALALYREVPDPPTGADGQPLKLNRADEVRAKPLSICCSRPAGAPTNLTALPLAERVEMRQMAVARRPAMGGCRIAPGRRRARRGALISIWPCSDATHRAPSITAPLDHRVAFGQPQDARRRLAPGRPPRAKRPSGFTPRSTGSKPGTTRCHRPTRCCSTDYETSALLIEDRPKAIGENLVPPGGCRARPVGSPAGCHGSEPGRCSFSTNWLPANSTRSKPCSDVFRKMSGALGSCVGTASRPAVHARSRRPQIAAWLRTTPLVEHSPLAEQSLAWFVLCRETNFRATSIILALEAWKLRQGELPGSLDDLVGSELDTVPLDPLWAEPFLYYPAGIPPFRRRRPLRIRRCHCESRWAGNRKRAPTVGR